MAEYKLLKKNQVEKNKKVTKLHWDMFADLSKLEAVEKVRNKLHRWINHE